MKHGNRLVLLCAALCVTLGTVPAGYAQTFKRNLKEKEDPVEFKMKKGETYTIDMVARFDTFLKLKDPNGKQVAYDDDGSGTLNARLIHTAKQTGTYTIVATSFNKRSTGPYTLTIKAGVTPAVLAAKKFQIGAVAPEIKGVDVDGVKFKLSDYRGKVVVIDFWGDW